MMNNSYSYENGAAILIIILLGCGILFSIVLGAFAWRAGHKKAVKEAVIVGSLIALGSVSYWYQESAPELLESIRFIISCTIALVMGCVPLTIVGIVKLLKD